MSGILVTIAVVMSEVVLVVAVGLMILCSIVVVV